MLDLAIIIVNYRTPSVTTECLASILPEASEYSIGVVVVDNASGDNSVSLIEDWCKINDSNSIINVISSAENLGFSGGNNIGIKSVHAKYYLLLNSDTLLHKDALKILIETASKSPKAGLVTPMLIGPDGSPQESCFNFMTPVSEFISAARTGFVYKILSKFTIPLPITNETSSPPWSSFACVLIRSEVFNDIGLLDDGFFMYYEDAEFCYRARKAGWDIINEPSAQVIHLGGMSSSFNDDLKSRKRTPRYLYESRARFFYILYGRAGLLAANLLWLLGRIISKSIQCMGRSNKAIPHKQWLDIWINFLNPLARGRKL